MDPLITFCLLILYLAPVGLVSLTCKKSQQRALWQVFCVMFSWFGLVLYLWRAFPEAGNNKPTQPTRQNQPSQQLKSYDVSVKGERRKTDRRKDNELQPVVIVQQTSPSDEKDISAFSAPGRRTYNNQTSSSTKLQVK